MTKRPETSKPDLAAMAGFNGGLVDLFMDMPCEFKDDFREEFEAYEREIKAERQRVA